MKRKIKKMFLGIYNFFEKAVVLNCKKLWLISQRSRLVNKYLMSYQVHKLQLGGGANLLDGWLNTDFLPRHKEVIILDATKPFFFKKNCFDYIFCEHMIEHISYQDTMCMLKECFRILKPEGKIRISTPDLEVYLELFAAQKSELQKQHLAWIGKNWLQRQGIHSCNEAFVLNLMMHSWGHKFIYDFKTLEFALKESGFSHITRASVKQSDENHFKGIEKHGDYIQNIKGIKNQSGSEVDNKMNEFGTLTVEASRK